MARQLLALTACVLVPCVARANPQIPSVPPHVPTPPADQFGTFQTPPYPLDQVRGEWVNLETELIKPIITAVDGTIVAAINEPDDRVVFFDTNLVQVGETMLGQGLIALAERPAPVGTTPREIWVSVHHESAVMVITTAGFNVTHLLRPNIAGNAIGAGTAALPGGIAFTADGTKAYVAATASDAVVVYDAVNKTVLRTIPLTALHNGQSAALNDPYYVIEYQGAIYVASHNSGNDTIAESGAGDPATHGSNILGADDVKIVDLGADPNRSLPDFDVARIDPVTDTVTHMVRGLGSMIFGLASHTPTNRIAVSSFDSRNADFIGERSFPDGRVAINQVAHFLATNPPGAASQTVVENLGPAGDDIVMPTDMTSDAAGFFYVAGLASAKIGVWASNAQYVGAISTPSGPCGLAVSKALSRLYCLNRGAGSVTAYDISHLVPAAPIATFTFHDPTFDRVKAGRQVFLTPNSGVGTPNEGLDGCFSCHPFGRKDGLGWQLSKFIDPTEGFTEASPPAEWKDLKGVMVTQDLRSLPDNPPYHWRGEQKDLEDFNGAFKGLLKGTELTPSLFAQFKDYVFSLVYPANPRQPMNRVYSPDGLAGFSAFNDPVVNGDGNSCTACHSMPTGTNCEMTEAIVGFSPTPRATKTAHLRAMFTKSSALANIDQTNPTSTLLWPMTGFGFAHEGLFDSVEQFNFFFFSGGSGGAFLPKIPFVNQFIDELDLGLAPATAYSLLLNQATAGSINVRLRNYLMAQSIAGNCDIAVKGRLFLSGAWKQVGLFHAKQVSGTTFRPDDSSLGDFQWLTLRQMATAGQAELLFVGVPVGSGERMGVDRDRDGVYDADEVRQGLNPKNPDTDGDYLWDSYDPLPLNPNGHILPASSPIVSNVTFVFENTNAIKIQYDTDTFSPSRVEFGETTSYGFFAGDPLLPTSGPNPPSNHWKRHHTVIIRPQPGQGLLGLKDGTTHHFRIWTQGQNGVVAQTTDFTRNTLADLQQPNRRVGSMVLNGVANPDGSRTYTATVTIVTNDGTAPAESLVPARFAFYDQAQPFGPTSTAAVTTVHMAKRTTGGVAVFQATTAPGFQGTGDLTTFDVPMRLDDSLLGGQFVEVLGTSVPTGFGTGTPGPVIDLTGLVGSTLDVTANGNWCRNATACSGPAGDPGQICNNGPLPGDLFNLLGGEWVGVAPPNNRFAVGSGTSVVVPSGATGLQLFFNDDLNQHGDNTGAVDVQVRLPEVIAFAGQWPQGALATETAAP